MQLETPNSALSPQLDLFAVRAGEDDSAPAVFARLAGRRVMRSANQLHPVLLQVRDGLIEFIGFQAKMKTAHGAVGMVRQLKDRVAQLQVRDLESAARRVLKIMFKAEVPLVKVHGTVKIGYMNCHVIDAPEHKFVLNGKDRLFAGCFASLPQ